MLFLRLAVYGLLFYTQNVNQCRGSVNTKVHKPGLEDSHVKSGG